MVVYYILCLSFLLYLCNIFIDQVTSNIITRCGRVAECGNNNFSACLPHLCPLISYVFTLLKSTLCHFHLIMRGFIREMLLVVSLLLQHVLSELLLHGKLTMMES